MKFGRAPSTDLGHLPPQVRAWLDEKPNQRLPWRKASWTVLDLETTGLDTARDAILQVGLVNIEEGRIRLDTAWKSLVRPPEGTVFRKESILVHGLMPDRLASAPTLEQVLVQLASRLKGRIPVGHMALDFDAVFLSRAMEAVYGIPFASPFVDTVRLEEHLRGRILHLRYGAGASRLSDLARHLGLPVYREHDALSDALTCAQVFLVLATRMEGLGSGQASHLIGAR